MKPVRMLRVFIIESPYLRAAIPLLIVGASGILSNIIAWDVTKNGSVELSRIASLPLTYVWLGLSIILVIYEIRVSKLFSRLTKETFGQLCIQKVLPEFIDKQREHIGQGEYTKFHENLENMKKTIDSLNATEEEFQGRRLRAETTIYCKRQRVCTIYKGTILTYHTKKENYFLSFRMNDDLADEYDMYATNYSNQKTS